MRKALLLSLTILIATVVAANDLAPDVLLENGHLKRLRAVAEQKLKTNGNDAAAQYYLAYIKFQEGDLDGSLALVEKAAAADPKNAEYRYLIASIYGRKAESASIFSQLGLARRFKKEAETAIELNPLHIDARIGLMEYHLRAPGIAGGDKKKAEQYVNEIMRIDPARGYLAQARKARIEKETSQLESLYLKAMEANPKSYEAHLTAANFFANAQQKYDLAEQHTKEALKLEEDRIGAYNSLAGLYAHLGRWQDLDKIIAAAEKAVPDNPAPYFFAARVLSGNGKDNARAERYLQKYLSSQPEINGPTFAVAHWRLGLVYEKMGRKADAIREIETALRMNKDLDDAKKDLKRIKG